MARALHLTVSKSGHSLSTRRGDPLKQPIDCGAAKAVVTRDVIYHVVRVSFETRRVGVQLELRPGMGEMRSFLGRMERQRMIILLHLILSTIC